jgi:ubiquitin fusion degradation protein 1
MMDNLLLSVGDLVNLKNVSLPKGSFIKIQPHTTKFIDIANPKAVLETCLRSFTCLTEVSPTPSSAICTQIQNKNGS